MNLTAFFNMKHALLSVAIFSLAGLSATAPVVAKPKKTEAAPQKEVAWDWWYVYGAGQSPSREIIYIDAKSVTTEVDHEAVLSGAYKFDPKNPKKKPPSFVEADGVTVFEDAKKKPARWNGRVRVNCATQQMMMMQSYKQYWQTERFEKVLPTHWFDANAELKFQKIALFLCDPKIRDDKGIAQAHNNKHMMMRVDQTSDPLDRTWALAWSDVQKPEFISKKTKEQAQADFDKTAARGLAIIAEGTKQANDTQARILRDEKVTAMEQRALFGKMRSKASPLLHSWLGADERALVASWGVPNSSHDAANARFLSYVYGFDRQYQTQDGNGNVLASSREEFSCNMTFEVRNGIIKDYRSDGNYCRTAASSMARGPN